MPPLLEIEDLSVDFRSPLRTVHALNQVSMTVNEGEVIGIVGESGCGKSTLAYSIMKLLPQPPAFTSGHIRFSGEDIVELSEKRMRSIRGNDISIVFQDPMSSLNPGLKVGDQIGEPLRIHKDDSGRKRNGTKLEGKEVKGKVIEVLHRVQMPNPDTVYNCYPYELSGGMRQRAAIATALINEPKVLIADEPTSSLDVTIQAQIIRLFSTLKRKIKTTLILITHDLGVAASICDRIAVMYAGNLMEVGSVDDIFHSPAHPYTTGLLKATPRAGNKMLQPIPGDVPNLIALNKGCPFQPRCLYSKEICSEVRPTSRPMASTGGQPHYSYCHFADTISN
ncbi:MAG TPA: ABC transporter ATP-binding protein [Nitrososphaerales archaeon]|nr:ABC transporter ATP-binding protein [Nitrososphaerales archaeon]